MNAINALSRIGGGARATRKWNRDYVPLASSLLPPLDVVSLLVSGFACTALYKHWFSPAGVDFGVWGGNDELALIALAMVAALCLYDGYFGTRSSRRQTGPLVRRYASGFVTFASAALVLAVASDSFAVLPDGWLSMFFGMSFVLTSLSRVLLAWKVRRLERAGVLTEAIAIIGAGELAGRLIAHLHRSKGDRVEILGVFDDRAACGEGTMPAGTIEELIEIGKSRHIDSILLTLPCTEGETVHSIVHRLKALAVPVGLCPQNVGLELPCHAVDYVGGGVPVTMLADHRMKADETLDVLLPRGIGMLVELAVEALTIAAGTTVRRVLDACGGAAAAAPTSFAVDGYDTAGFARVAQRYGSERYGYVVTPNVDHLIRLHEDADFRALYAGAAYRLNDSRFLTQLVRATRRIALPVCTGSDLTAKLLGDVIMADDRVVLVGGSDAQAREIEERFRLRGLVHINPPMGFIRDPDAVEACLQFVEAHSPFRFCLIAVGSPQQEIIAQRLGERGVARGLALCVGASIDFLTGRERRAPAWLQRAGLEWAFRLVQAPGRMAHRYLVRGPRVFRLLRRTEFLLSVPPQGAAPIVQRAQTGATRPSSSKAYLPSTQPLPKRISAWS
jgi:exopolysaccharide biosynthesis WecB/TagA/CpsF family protein